METPKPVLQFIVHQNGYADLLIDGVHVQEVSRSSGLNEAINKFNKCMRDKGWMYRLDNGFPALWKEMMEEKP